MTASAASEEDALLGRVIAGKLEVVERLGSGSMGHVYRARHRGLDKDVAIKVLRETSSSDPVSSQRFATEAKAASRLSHPNSVAILDFGEDGQDRLLYIAMELVEGDNLQQIIDRGTLLAVDRICRIMTQVLAALAAAHDAKVIHRDIKPSNIVLVRERNDDGELVERVKVCDFGVAKLSESARNTLQGSDGARVVGTPLYMSPEQATGEELDVRTDVYSCGIIMYEMLTGQPPFQAEQPMAVLMKHVSEAPTPPSALVPGVPVELEALILWAIEKRRNLRPATAREFRTALRAYLAGKAHTVEALGRYGVEVESGSDPWTGPTPHEMALPTTAHSLLAAPPLPKIPEPSSSTRPRPSHTLTPPLRTGSDLTRATGPERPLFTPLPALTPPPGLEPFPKEESSSVDKNLESLFGSTSYFETKRRTPLGTDAVRVQRPISRPATASRQTQRPPTSNHYLSERFGLSRDRTPPGDGFWFRDALSRELGPLSWSELTHILRVESSVSGAHVMGTSVSTEPSGAWTTTRRFTEALDLSPLVWQAPSEVDAKFRGRLEDRSISWVFGHLSFAARTGVLRISTRSARRKAEYALHIHEGQLSTVETNEPHLQTLSLMESRGLLASETTLAVVRSILEERLSLTQALERSASFDIDKAMDATRQERLRNLLRWPGGDYQLSMEPPKPASLVPQFIPSILPDLVYRAVARESLLEALEVIKDVSIAPTPVAKVRLKQMKLSPSQLKLAHTILGARQLDDVLPKQGKLRKAYTTMAYVLWQLGLIAPHSHESR